MKYTTINEKGVPTAFYSDDIHKLEDIPTDAIKITDKIYQKLVDGNGSQMWDTKTKSVKSYTHIPSTEEINSQNNAKVVRELNAIDLASIRDIRQWISEQPTASSKLIELEAHAVTARGKFL